MPRRRGRGGSSNTTAKGKKGKKQCLGREGKLQNEGGGKETKKPKEGKGGKNFCDKAAAHEARMSLPQGGKGFGKTRGVERGVDIQAKEKKGVRKKGKTALGS